MIFSILKVFDVSHHLCFFRCRSFVDASKPFSLGLFPLAYISEAIDAVVRAEHAVWGVTDPYKYQVDWLCLRIDPAICHKFDAPERKAVDVATPPKAAYHAGKKVVRRRGGRLSPKSG